MIYNISENVVSFIHAQINWIVWIEIPRFIEFLQIEISDEFDGIPDRNLSGWLRYDWYFMTSIDQRTYPIKKL